jgi:hypothetical protein
MYFPDRGRTACDFLEKSKFTAKQVLFSKFRTISEWSRSQVLQRIMRHACATLRCAIDCVYRGFRTACDDLGSVALAFSGRKKEGPERVRAFQLPRLEDRIRK